MRNIYSIYKEHYKALISLGLPIVIGQIGVIVLGFADTLMIGHHSTIEQLLDTAGRKGERPDFRQVNLSR